MWEWATRPERPRGQRADLIAVRVPHGVTDVEEYLVSGVQPSAITWLDAVRSPGAPRQPDSIS